VDAFLRQPRSAGSVDTGLGSALYLPGDVLSTIVCQERNVTERSGRTELPPLASQNRFSWKLRTPIGPGEVRRIERWLATARLTLAISALFALWMDRTQISWWAHWLLGIYIIHGTVVMFLLRFRKQSTPAFRSLVHAADLVWPALISAFATGTGNPFFLFSVFVLAAAAYRWGLWETVGTATATVILLWLESVAVHLRFLGSVEGFFLRHHWPPLGIDVVELKPKHLFLRSVYLLVMGWLIGYLAERQKQLRAEVERGRFAGELHDGALQSMIAVAMQLDVLRRRSASQAATVAQELGRIHDLLLEEARKLRELMQQIKPLDLEAKNLRAHFMELVERFQRETGITARFVCESTVVSIRPPQVCDAVLRIVQEGLVNVRKHSGANHVRVQLDRGNGHLLLTIEDDGRGFPFSGCFSQADLEADGRGPSVIKETVRLIDGELKLESIAGRGSRLVITIPQRQGASLRILSNLIRSKLS
jgi:signal transduction histidine kinase